MHRPSRSTSTGAEERSRALSGAAKRNIATVSIIGAIVVAALLIAGQATKPRLTGDTISQTFSPGEPCATASIALAARGNTDPEKTAESLFAAIKPIPGLTTGSYNWKTSQLEIGFCESQSSEAAIRQALAPTGLVAEGGAAQPPASDGDAATQ
jgi:hypothetical protein